MFPPTSTDRTDKNGYAQVVEGEKTYNVIVEDTKAKIENAAVEVKDGKNQRYSSRRKQAQYR